MFNNKEVIVSMTSWTKRIDNVSKVVFSILKNTIKPDRIICNLSTDEFKNKENDLPEDLLKLTKLSNFEINWVKKNTTVFKKFIPTIKRFYPNDYYLFTIDDDEIYDETYIETGLNALLKDMAVVIAKRKENSTGVWGGMFCCRSEIFEPDYWENLSDDIIKNGMNDPYTNRYLKYKNISIKNILECHTNPFNPVFPNRKGLVYSKEKIEYTENLVNNVFKNFVSKSRNI